MNQFVNCQHVPGWPWRANCRSCGPWPWEVNLFFGWESLKEGLPLGNARDAGFSWASPVNWAWREAQLDPSGSSCHWTGIPGQGSQGLKMSQDVLFMNPNPLNQWGGPKNIVKIQIDGESSWALLDSGSTINVVTSEFIEVPSLDIDPLSNLTNGTLGINGFGWVFS